MLLFWRNVVQLKLLQHFTGNTTEALFALLAALNGLLMATVGGSDWTLCSAFVLLSRIIHTTWVYPLTLYPPFFGFYFFNGLLFVLQILHVFWAALILRMVVKFLPGNVRTLFPHFRCSFECLPVRDRTELPSCTWQDIVEDERSDKEETESEDEDEERREKWKNGHVQNGHASLNGKHQKRD